jgi:hypothetical protein
MAEVTITVILEEQDEAILRERTAIVIEHIRSGMFGCNAPDNPNAWKFRISHRLETSTLDSR